MGRRGRIGRTRRTKSQFGDIDDSSELQRTASFPASGASPYLFSTLHGAVPTLARYQRCPGPIELEADLPASTARRGR